MSLPTGDQEAAATWLQLRPELIDLAEALCARLAVLDHDPHDQAAWDEARRFARRLAGTLRAFGPEAARDAAATLFGLIGAVEQVELDRLSRAQTLAEAIRLALIESD